MTINFNRRKKDFTQLDSSLLKRAGERILTRFTHYNRAINDFHMLSSGQANQNLIDFKRSLHPEYDSHGLETLRSSTEKLSQSIKLLEFKALSEDQKIIYNQIIEKYTNQIEKTVIKLNRLKNTLDKDTSYYGESVDTILKECNTELTDSYNKLQESINTKLPHESAAINKSINETLDKKYEVLKNQFTEKSKAIEENSNKETARLTYLSALHWHKGYSRLMFNQIIKDHNNKDQEKEQNAIKLEIDPLQGYDVSKIFSNKDLLSLSQHKQLYDFNNNKINIQENGNSYGINSNDVPSKNRIAYFSARALALKGIGCNSISYNLQCSNDKEASKIAYKAYSAFRIAGFDKEKITITVNGKKLEPGELEMHMDVKAKNLLSENQKEKNANYKKVVDDDTKRLRTAISTDQNPKQKQYDMKNILNEEKQKVAQSQQQNNDQEIQQNHESSTTYRNAN